MRHKEKGRESGQAPSFLHPRDSAQAHCFSETDASLTQPLHPSPLSPLQRWASRPPPPSRIWQQKAWGLLCPLGLSLIISGFPQVPNHLSGYTT